MDLPLQITFRGLAHSAALERAIRVRARKLERFHRHLGSCRVVVELPDRHKRHGKQFVVRLDLKVPGGEIAINNGRHEDVRVALRDAFDAAVRKLEESARGQR